MSSPLKEDFTLTPRLKAIADMIRKAGVNRLADIGTDHAKLPLYLIREGICDFCYAADVREGPLSHARKNCEILGIGEERIRILLSDGLRSVPDDYDGVSVCGMGGLLIFRILSEAKRNVPFIVSPMSSGDELCRALYDGGYEITDAAVAREDRRFYPVYRVEKCLLSTDKNDFDCLFPSALRSMLGKDETVAEYMKFTLELMKKNAVCREASSKSEPGLPALKRLIGETEAFLNERMPGLCR